MHLATFASLPFAAFALSAQTMPETLESAAPMPNLSDPHSARCASLIREVRDAGEQPALQRGPATGEEGYLIAAVDKRIEGCAVMQMHGNVNDLRPLPEVKDEDFRLRPAAD